MPFPFFFNNQDRRLTAPTALFRLLLLLQLPQLQQDTGVHRVSRGQRLSTDTWQPLLNQWSLPASVMIHTGQLVMDADFHIAITMYGARWILDLLGWRSLCKAYKGLIPMLYNIISFVNYNWKIHLKKECRFPAAILSQSVWDETVINKHREVSLTQVVWGWHFWELLYQKRMCCFSHGVLWSSIIFLAILRVFPF